MHYQEFATVLLNYHIGRFFLSSLCVGDLVRLGLSSARVAGFSLQYGPRTAVAQWLRRCAINRKVAGSIPDGVIGIFH